MKYKPGRLNTNADALSRMFEKSEEAIFAEIAVEQKAVSSAASMPVKLDMATEQ